MLFRSTFKQLRGMLKLALKRMERHDVRALIGSDSVKAKAWHVELFVELTKQEIGLLIQSLEHFCLRHRLATSNFTEVQFKLGIHNSQSYIGNHPFLRYNVKIS